jgi:Protein tyrosine/serine phosphatase
MARTVRATRPFKLDGARNVRELGGYPTKYGINTACGQFIRSDNPSKFTEADLTRLYDYGVRLQVDFRSTGETSKEPSKLQGFKDIEWSNPQLMDTIVNAEGQNAMPPTLGELYIGFLDNKQDKFLEVYKNIINNHMDHCVLFNCTAGKDRTGTFAMTMLKLAGCTDEVVVEDYQVTGDNIRIDMDKLLAEYAARGIHVNEDDARSRPVHMEKALGHLRATYGTIEDWMLKCGLTVGEIDKLRSKILGQF